MGTSGYFFDQAVLHPVLADLACLAVGRQFVGIKRDVEVQIVVDHDLNRAALNAVALYSSIGLPCSPAGAEAVAIDSPRAPPAHPFLRHLHMVVGMNITQRIFDCQRFVGFAQMGILLGARRMPSSKAGIFWKLIIKFDHHGFFRFIGHKENLLNIFY